MRPTAGPAASRPDWQRISAFLEELARAPDRDLAEIFGGLAPGELLGRFQVVREIGRGAFGVIYEAEDRELGRRVALKVLRPRGPAARPDEGWLKREAEAAAQLNHPGIVTVHDVGSGPAGPYMVLELLRGETLHDRMQRGLVPPREAVRIATEVVAALAHAHAAGLLHRDLKPSNVFLTEDGAVKVLDFGLSRFVGRRGLRGGTPAYMAPEQWRGEEEGPRTDLFAVGVLLYEMLAGSLPFPVVGGRSAVLDPEPAPLLPLPRAPRRLTGLVANALEQDPARRPRNALVLLERLREMERQLAGAPRRRRRLRLGAAGALVLALAAGAALSLRRCGPETEARIAVLVADVANDTGERDLDGLSGLLITSLEQSRRLAVLTRTRVLDILRQLGREPEGRLDEELGRAAGRRAQAQALFLATVRRFDQVYSLELRAVDPATGELMFALREDGRGKSSIPGLIDRLSERIRRELREGRGDIRASGVKVGEAVTQSLEAYQHYFLGLDCFDRPSHYPGHPEPCIEEFRRAIAVDPGFAMARLYLTLSHSFETAPTDADRAEMAAAMRGVDRAPFKERLLIRAGAARVEGRFAEAEALYQQATAAFPEDKHVLYFAGDLPFHREELGEAAGYFDRLLKLDPSFDWALDHLSYALAVLGRMQELAAWDRSWSEMAATGSVLHARAQAQLGLGDPRSAAALARRSLEWEESALARYDLVRALMLAGDYAAVEDAVRALPAGSPRRAYLLARALSAQGRRAEGARLLDAVERSAADPEARRDVRYLRALHRAGDGDSGAVFGEARALMAIDGGMAANLAVPLAYLGDLSHARQLAPHLRSGSPSEEIYRALVEWREGRPAGARGRLDAVEQSFPAPRESIAPAFLRGEVAAAEGLDAEAVEALQRYLRLPFQGYWQTWAYPRALFLLARAFERMGRREEAQREVDRLLALWSRADPGLPLLREARALGARLRSASRPPPAKAGPH